MKIWSGIGQIRTQGVATPIHLIALFHWQVLKSGVLLLFLVAPVLWMSWNLYAVKGVGTSLIIGITMLELVLAITCVGMVTGGALDRKNGVSRSSLPGEGAPPWGRDLMLLSILGGLIVSYLLQILAVAPTAAIPVLARTGLLTALIVWSIAYGLTRHLGLTPTCAKVTHAQG